MWQWLGRIINVFLKHFYSPKCIKIFIFKIVSLCNSLSLSYIIFYTQNQWLLKLLCKLKCLWNFFLFEVWIKKTLFLYKYSIFCFGWICSVLQRNWYIPISCQLQSARFFFITCQEHCDKLSHSVPELLAKPEMPAFLFIKKNHFILFWF